MRSFGNKTLRQIPKKRNVNKNKINSTYFSRQNDSLFFVDVIRDYKGIREGSPLGNNVEEGDPTTWRILSENMKELTELLSLDTKFRVKHRLFAKVSFVMAHHFHPSDHHHGNDHGTVEMTPEMVHDARSGLTRQKSISSPNLAEVAAAAASKSKAKTIQEDSGKTFFWLC